MLSVVVWHEGTATDYLVSTQWPLMKANIRQLILGPYIEKKKVIANSSVILARFACTVWTVRYL